MCDARLLSEKSMDLHYHAQHKKIKRHQCLSCNKKFKFSYNLTRHIIKVHEEKIKQRQDKVFSKKSDLDRHAGIKTFGPEQNSTRQSCSKCDRIFATRRKLNRHNNAVHLNFKRFVCTICGTSFKRKIVLNKHLSKHNKVP